MNGALDAVFARPSNHLLRGLAILDGAQPDLAHQFNACIGHVFEVLFLHPFFDHGRTCVHLDAGGAEVFVPTLRGDRHRLQPYDVFGTPGHMNLTGGDHGCDPPVQGAVDPVQLLLAWGIVPHDRMHVAVDQPRREGDAMGVDHCCRPVAIKILFVPERADLAAGCNHTIAVKDRRLHLAGQDQSDVTDHEFLGHGGPFRSDTQEVFQPCGISVQRVAIH